MSNTIKVITGSRCSQYEIIQEAIDYLESQKNDSYLNDDMAVIIQLARGAK
jgi:hypothetical protein